jgi:cob(I)alamin adenosyltransferase
MTEYRTDPLEAPKRPTPKNGRKAPVPKQKKPGKYRVPPRMDRHGLVIVNTGDGKGKTTAALGLLLRATGRRMSAAMYQFVKRMDDGGEHRTATRLGVDILALGAGCTLGREDVREDAELARLGWERCRALITEGVYDVLVLDELTLPLAWGWLDVEDVVAALQARPIGTHVVITGRSAPQRLIDAADLVTDMRVVKHAFTDRGLRAQAGIDV